MQLEYKERLGKEHNREFAETVASFANCYGGVILLGVADDTTIVGYDVPKLPDTITNIVRTNVHEYLEPVIRRVVFDGKPLWVIQVPEGERPPYQSNGRTMVRANGTDRPASPNEIRALVAKAARQGARGVSRGL